MAQYSLFVLIVPLNTNQPLYLIQLGGDWAGCVPAQSPPSCTKCISPPINGQCVNFILFAVAL